MAVAPDLLGSFDTRSIRTAARARRAWWPAAATVVAATIYGYRAAGIGGGATAFLFAYSLAKMALFLFGLTPPYLAPWRSRRGKVQRGLTAAYIALLLLGCWLGGWRFGWLGALLSGIIYYAALVRLSPKLLGHENPLNEARRLGPRLAEEARKRRADGALDAATADEGAMLARLLDAADASSLTRQEIARNEATRPQLVELYLGLIRDGADVQVGADFVPASSLCDHTALGFLLVWGSDITGADKAAAVVNYFKGGSLIKPSPEARRADTWKPVFPNNIVELFDALSRSSTQNVLRRETIPLDLTGNTAITAMNQAVQAVKEQVASGEARGIDQPLMQAITLGQLLDCCERGEQTRPILVRHRAHRRDLAGLYERLTRHGGNIWIDRCFVAGAALLQPETLTYLLASADVNDFDRVRAVASFFRGTPLPDAAPQTVTATGKATYGVRTALVLPELLKRGRYDVVIGYVQKRFDASTLDAPSADNSLNYYLGLAYLGLGRLGDAQARLEHAVESSEYIDRMTHQAPMLRAGGIHDFEFARNLVQLGLIRLRCADALGARDALKQAIARLAAVPTSPGATSPMVAMSLPHLEAVGLDALGAAHEALDSPLKAEQCYRSAREVRRTVFGDGDPELARSDWRLGALALKSGRRAEAEQLLITACDAFRKAKLDGDMEYGLALVTLGTLLVQAGRIDEGAVRLEDFLRQRATAHEWGFEDLIACFLALARVDIRHGDLERASGRLRSAVAGIDFLSKEIFRTASERQRALGVCRAREGIDAFASLVTQYFRDDETLRRELFQSVLRYKAVGAELFVAQRKAIHARGDPALADTLRRLSLVREKAAQIELRSGFTGETRPRALLKRLAAEREDLEKALARAIFESETDRLSGAAALEGVRSALPADAILVEFFVYGRSDFTAAPVVHAAPRDEHMLAIVFAGSEPAPRAVVDLGECAAIDALVTDLHGAISRQPFEATQRADELGHMLRRIVFDPLVPHFDRRTHIFLATDGSLSRVPFQILPASDDERLIDRYRMTYLTTGRDLLAGDGAAQSTPPFVGAAPDYWLAAPGPRARSTPGSARLSFRPLKGTELEGQTIAGMLNVQPVTGRDFVEPAVKSCRSPVVMHLATHGFFLGPSSASGTRTDPAGARHLFAEDAGGPGTADDEDSAELAIRARLEGPMLRSGLALGGANTWLEGGTLPQVAEDGILTAEEVVSIDARGTELAVLSACDTGLGDIEFGEGVMGMGRAFALSGCRSLVLSLWKVSDDHTRDLMAAFYRALLDGCPRDVALHKAQQDLRSRFPQPYFWGAFICQGQTGPIPALLEMGNKQKRLDAAHVALQPGAPPRDLTEDRGLAAQLAGSGRVADALSLAEAQLARARDWYPDGHRDLLQALGAAAECLCQSGGSRNLRRARELGVERLESARRTYGEIDAETIDAMASLGETHSDLDEFAEARTLFEAVVEWRRPRLGADAPTTLAALVKMTAARAATSEPEPAHDLVQQAYDTCRASLGDRHPVTLEALDAVVFHEMKRDNYAQARSLLETLVELRRATLGECHPETLVTLSTLATVLMTPDIDEALRLQRYLYDVELRVFGGNHTQTLFSKWMMGSMLHIQGYREEGLQLCEEALQRARALWSEEEPRFLCHIMSHHAGLHEAAGNQAAALGLYEEVYRRRTALGLYDRDTLDAMKTFAGARAEADPSADTIALLAECVELCARHLGEDDELTMLTANQLGVAARTVGDVARAAAAFERATAIAERVRGTQHRTTLQIHRNLVAVRLQSGDADAAVRLAEDDLAILRRTCGEEDEDTLRGIDVLGAGYLTLKDYHRVVALLEPSLPRFFTVLGEHEGTALGSLSRLGHAYLMTGRSRDAKGILELSAALSTRLYGSDDRRTEVERANLKIACEVISGV